MRHMTTRILRPPSSRSRGSFDSWSEWLREVFADRPERYSHSLAVGHRAALHARIELRHLDHARLDRFVLGALLHDIGRAIDPDDTEPHGIVGARYLDGIGLHDVAPFVAHHSGGRVEAALRGHRDLDRWTVTDRDLHAVLTYLDRTTSTGGEPVTLGERRTDLISRYGDGSIQLAVFEASIVDARRGADVLRDLARRVPLVSR